MKIPVFSDYAPATLIRSRPAALEQSFIDIDPPSTFGDAYERAGQFCKIRVQGDEGIFAMFSAPREQGARFLVRIGNPVGGEAADRLAALPEGAPIEMTLPAGEGFALPRARGRDVYFIATGTGIAPVRAAIETVLREREHYGALSLDHGLRSDAHLAIGDDIARWRSLGVDVRIHLSNPDADGSVHGITVQSALRMRAPNLRGAAVVAVGQPEMLEHLRAEAIGLGADPELFLVNV